MAERFAGRDKIAGAWMFCQLELGVLVTGSPALPDAVASFDCQVLGVSPVGEHLVVIGGVKATAFRTDAKPLLHWARAYGMPNAP